MKMVKKKTPLKKAAKGTAVKPKAMYGKTVKPGMMRKGGTLTKAQEGRTVKPKALITPFENYMKTPGSVPSDTLQSFEGYRNTDNPTLDKAYFDTYYGGANNERRKGSDTVKYDSSGNRIRQKGGTLTKARKGKGVISTTDGSTYNKSGKKIGSGLGKKAEYRDFATGEGDRVFAPAGIRIGGLKAKVALRKSNRDVTKKGNIKVSQKETAVKDSGNKMGQMAKPKAMYGKSVKLTKMGKGGTKKK